MTQGSSLVFSQYLTAILDTIADGILLISVEPGNVFRLALANKPFFDFSGYPEDSVGKLVPQIVSPGSYAFLARQYRKVIKTKQPLDYLRWTEMPAGLRALDVRLVPILSTTGDCVQIAAIIHDATEREQLRQEVERLRASVRGIRQNLE